MSILIKGMKMPKNCCQCPMMRPGNYKGHAFPCTCHAKDCFPIKPSELDLRDGLCPLVEIKPHGRLIDADALKQKKKHSNEFAENVISVAEIDWMPTIIEEDRT